MPTTQHGKVVKRALEITRIPPRKPEYEIAERYCARVDANVILTRVNEDATKPPEYRCLSSHLCSEEDAGQCRHYHRNPSRAAAKKDPADGQTLL